MQGQLYVHWVKEQANNNVPFNEMAYKLITAEGYPWENGAVGYYLRDAGMPLDNMSNTTKFSLVHKWFVPSATIIPLIAGHKWNTTKWHHTLTVSPRQKGRYPKQNQRETF